MNHTAKIKPTPPPGALLDPIAAAAFLGLSPWTLAAYRVHGNGPRWIRLGNRCRYAPAALAEWIEAHTGASTAEHDLMKKAG